MGADGRDDLSTRLDAWRARLVDLGRRNRLLYFRESRRGTLRLEEPTIEKLWAHLSREGTEVVFAAQNDGGELADEEPTAADTPSNSLTVRTTLAEAELGRTLANLYRKSRESIAELGIHTLHLVLGFLRWYESNSSDEEISSPLLLMPVELLRKKGGTICLHGLGDPPLTNVALVEKLRRSLSFEFPSLETSESPSPSPSSYLASIKAVLAELPRSSVHEKAVVGLFSFQKLVMYEDLGRNTHRALTNPIVRGLCGEMPASQEWDVPAGDELDRRIPYDQSFEVLDADSSQREAIAAARCGRSFVLVGPPGTGKSQTIANIIAAMIADQRRVLFVSEKRAALEVVEKRLRECGLGPFCLNLHRFRGDKRKILDQLGIRLQGVDESRHTRGVDLSQAELYRRGLNDYAEELHRPYGAAGLTPYEVHGRLSALADAPDLPFELMRPPADLDAQWFAQIEDLLAEAEALSHVYKEGKSHPWWGFERPVRDPEARAELHRALNDLRAGSQQVLRLGQDVAASVGLPAPSSIVSAEAIAQTAQILGRLQAGVAQPDWADRPSLHALVELAVQAQEASAALTRARAALDAVYRPSLYADDLAGLCQRLAHYERSWWGRVWTARPDLWTLRQYLQDPTARRTFAQFAADVKCLREVRQRQKWSADNEDDLRSVAGEAYRGTQTDWGAVVENLRCVMEVKAALRPEFTTEPTKWLRDCLENLGGLPSELAVRGDLLATKAKELLDLAGSFRDSFAGEFDPFGGRELCEVDLRCVGEWAETALRRLPDAGDWGELIRVGRCAYELGVADLHGLLAKSPEAAAQPRRAFWKRLYLLWLRAAYAERGALAEFGLSRMERWVSMFRELDAAAIASGSTRVRASAVRLSAGSAAGRRTGQVAALKREIRRRRPRPIRQILEDTPELIQALTPCMLMSPLSVSQYLASDRLHFDLVIFDEASQVRPEDALPAIFRGDALIVAGDSRQLPPTNFFEASLSDDYNEDAPEETLESILDECATWLPEVRLRWHYRSRDDSLIAFSNRYFYENSLVTFPNAQRGNLHLGPQFVLCEEGVYDRSGSRTNRNEARTVAVLIGQLHKRYPEDSIGVVALSQAQQEAIQDAIEDLARRDSMYEQFLTEADEPEGLFVKNLETVQGDERDTIILSVGYGRDEAGRLIMNFGPLNRDGGERRLNVAVSRARNRVVVVSSIRADDLPRTGSRGVVLLRSYLEYAERGAAALVSPADGGLGEVESPFEAAVRAALVERGLDVRAQVGCGAYRVDLAVVDPEHPGKYLLGIECDGATYHSGRTARDRDRLRQEVLERLGWRILRIWSTDWVKDPTRQIARVMEEVAKARALSDVPAEDVPAVSPTDAAESDPVVEANPRGGQELAADADSDGAGVGSARHVYRAAELGVVGTPESFYALAERSDPRFLSLVTKVVEVESPVHKDLVAKRLARAFGLGRCGTEIRRLVTRNLAALSRRDVVRMERGFVWSTEDRPVVVRTNEGALEPRDIEHIAAEEAREAVLQVVSESFGIGREDCATAVARAFGFERAGARIREWAGKAVDAAIADGELDVVGEATLILRRH